MNRRVVFVFGRIIAVVLEDWFPSIQSSKQSTAQPLPRLEAIQTSQQNNKCSSSIAKDLDDVELW
jgi:hypothetical protein